MAGHQRGALRGTARGAAPRRGTRASSSSSSSRNNKTRPRAPPPIVREMLAEAGVVAPGGRVASDAPERPRKRPRTGRRPEEVRAAEQVARLAASAAATSRGGPSAPEAEEAAEGHDDGDGDGGGDGHEEIEFEDVKIPEPTVQMTYLSSEDESDEDDDIQFEDVDIHAAATTEGDAGKATGHETGTLQLNLTSAREALTPSKRKKQPLTQEEKELRVSIHRVHLLLLLAVLERRNHWCNDPVVHATLHPLLPAKTVKFLNPGSNLTQFGQTESLKRGLQEAVEIFRERFKITEVGLRRALWAEAEEDLKDVECPKNLDSCLDKEDFRKAARTLEGSRDVGALLFCALLRAVGVEARLVFSLQPLSFVPGGPALSKRRKLQTPSRSSRPAPVTPVSQPQPAEPSAFPSAIRSRLGHPNATAYHVPSITPPQVVEWESPQQRRATLGIKESEYPVFWSEVLDVGHQKWQPVDAVVTGTHFKPHKLEPPFSDRDNILSYVIAMEDDGAARDVTRRYAKAYTAKTQRFRMDRPLVPAAVGGARWWRKALRRYRSREPSDLDQIEDTELNAIQAREPMPRNVVDFKDHPIYALERHLRRHEVLVPGAQVVGTIGAGSKGPLERIYRRKDVRATKSADKWYRLGREIITGEEPLKVLPKRKTTRRKGRFRHLEDKLESSDEDDPVLGPDPAQGVPHFAYEQTQLYVPPPVVAGRIPKNRFKNLDVYVPSMVPAGGFHFKHPRAGHAAHILGVDYAPALQGFEFKGRQGTAVYNGVVIPVEAIEAVRAVITGFRDMEAQMEEERRSRRALEMWRGWMRTLTIRRRLFEGDEYWGDTELGEFEIPSGEGEADAEAEAEAEVEKEHGEAEHQGSHRRRRPRLGMVLDDEDEDGGFEPGGFEPEPGGFAPGGLESGDYGGGGFEPEYSRSGGFGPGGFEPGGFEPGGFEPGGLEPEGDVQGKGKAPEHRIFTQPTCELDHPRPANLDAADDNSAQEAGGFAMEADVDMAEASPWPAEETAAAAVQETEVASQSPDKEGAHDNTTDAVDKNRPSSLAADAEQLSDTEQEASDAHSDVTEEFFMDEDGTLVD